MRILNLTIKRIFDVLMSITGLLVLSPLFLIISILIKTDGPGPIFFTQDRIGKEGKTFTIYKFRTMIVNAENIGDGISIKSANDSRITKTGRFLRKYSLDEIPQLVNVLIGNMSLVGPRPPVLYTPYDGYENYPEWAKKRFEFRPGITGLAQVTVRNSVFWDERIKIDLEYIDNFNVVFDFKILVMTFVKAVKHESVYLE